MNKQMTSALAQGNQTEVILVGKDGQAEVMITSVELTRLINQFRQEEGNTTEKEHSDLLKSIRSEIETLEKAGIKGQGNFSPTSYIDNWNREKPCYSMNKSGVLQMLNKESAVVRYKTVQYIEKLEKENEKLRHDSYMIDDPIERAKTWIIEQQEKQVLQLENAQNKQIIGELKPKATYYDLVLQSTDLMPITLIAKDYGMGAQTLNRKLNELGVQYKRCGSWLLYDKYHAKGYTQSKTQSFPKPDGTIGTQLHTQWTQKGRLFIYDILKQNGILPMIEREDR